MLGNNVVIKRRGRDEAEKPFWISFADLMSALMVLFLVVMSAALLSVTKRLTDQDIKQKGRAEDIQRRAEDIQNICKKFKEAAARARGISVACVGERQVIDFGDRAKFPKEKSSFTPDQQKGLREFAPKILAIANDDLGKKRLKRIVVEGFTDKNGSYLFNLNLSLERSQRVLCAMFQKPLPAERPLTEGEQVQIRALFLVGGYSFNAAKDTDEQSRRVEMRLEFLGIGESRPDGVPAGNLGRCALDAPAATGR